MSRKVKLGLIGCGVIGHAHAQAADTCADGELVATHDRDLLQFGGLDAFDPLETA